MQRYEARIWQRFSRTVLIGSADLAALRRACAEENQPMIDNAILIPHGADLGHRPPLFASDDGNTVLFLGVMSTNTNVDAVLWFTEHVWPSIRQARPGARFLVAGRRPRKAIQALHGLNGIKVLGEIDDPLPYLAKASVCISPVRAAAGMQNKLLDYFRAGRPVVATSTANEGIGAPENWAIRVADQPTAFADAVLDLLEDPAERARMGKAARRFVEHGWSWEALFLKLEQAIEATVRYPKASVLQAASSSAEPYLTPAFQPELLVAEPETPWSQQEQ